MTISVQKSNYFSNNIINAIMLGALEAQLEADKLDLNKLVLKIYSEVLEK